MEANIYVILPPRCIDFPQHSKVKIFHEMILKTPLHCETQTTWENLFFTVPIIKLQVFEVYVSVIGASMEPKIQVVSICNLFSHFSN